MSPYWILLLMPGLPIACLIVCGVVLPVLKCIRLRREPWHNPIAEGLRSPNFWCRHWGCVSYSKGYYSGMPQAHCYDCGARCWGASEGCPDFHPDHGLTDSWLMKLGVPLGRIFK